MDNIFTVDCIALSSVVIPDHYLAIKLVNYGVGRLSSITYRGNTYNNIERLRLSLDNTRFSNGDLLLCLRNIPKTVNPSLISRNPIPYDGFNGGLHVSFN